MALINSNWFKQHRDEEKLDWPCKTTCKGA